MNHNKQAAQPFNIKPTNGHHMGFREDDLIFLLKNNSIIYGGIIKEKPDSYMKLLVPKRYQYGPEGYIKQPWQKEIRIDHHGFDAMAASPEDLERLDPINPFIEALHHFVEISQQNHTHYGIISNVYDNHLLLSPNIQLIPLSGGLCKKNTEKLYILMDTASTPRVLASPETAEEDLEKMIMDINRQGITPEETEEEPGRAESRIILTDICCLAEPR